MTHEEILEIIEHAVTEATERCVEYKVMLRWVIGGCTGVLVLSVAAMAFFTENHRESMHKPEAETESERWQSLDEGMRALNARIDAVLIQLQNRGGVRVGTQEQCVSVSGLSEEKQKIAMQEELSVSDMATIYETTGDRIRRRTRAGTLKEVTKTREEPSWYKTDSGEYRYINTFFRVASLRQRQGNNKAMVPGS